MGLLDRMSRAASANFNALLDKLDDPRKTIEHTITEMEEQLRLARRDIVQGVASEKQLSKRVEELEAEAQKWAERAELAVRHGDDNLAREALRQRKRVSAERDRAEQMRVEQRGLALELRADLARMEQTLSDVKAKRGLLAARVAQARSGGGVEGLGAKPGSDAFGEFRRMEDQIEGVEAAIVAEREVSAALAPPPGPTGMSREEVEARFRALEAGGKTTAESDDLDAELTALKSRVRVDPG